MAQVIQSQPPVVALGVVPALHELHVPVGVVADNRVVLEAKYKLGSVLPAVLLHAVHDFPVSVALAVPLTG